MKIRLIIDYPIYRRRTDTVILAMGARFEIVRRRRAFRIPLEFYALGAVESPSGEITVVGVVEYRVGTGFGWKNVR